MKAQLAQLYQRLNGVQPQTENQQDAKMFGLLSVEEADEAYSQGDSEEGSFFKGLAEGFLDLALGLNPVTGLARDAYELLSGRNFVTGEELSLTEQIFSALGVLNFGTGSMIKKAGQGILKFTSKLNKRGSYLMRSHRVQTAQEVIQSTEQIAESAGRVGLRSVGDTKALAKFAEQAFGPEFHQAEKLQSLAETLEGAKGIRWRNFETFLQNRLGGEGSFKLLGKEFDGRIGKAWYEAKTTGNNWKIYEDPDTWHKFKSKIGSQFRIAKDHGASFLGKAQGVLLSMEHYPVPLHFICNTPLPPRMKKWLIDYGVNVIELLE